MQEGAAAGRGLRRPQGSGSRGRIPSTTLTVKHINVSIEGIRPRCVGDSSVCGLFCTPECPGIGLCGYGVSVAVEGLTP